MKILIAFYSRTGGTEKVAEVFKKELERRGHSIDVERVKPVQEHGFWGWFFLRIFKKECKIQPPAVKDASKYDAVCVGSPNWTRLSLPVARYLREVTGLKEKRVVFFSATAFLPSIEWYFFSAYFLDLTFSRIIKQKGGRIIGSILLSSKFKKWDFASKYGENAIKGLCDKIETPISSLKDFNLKQREIEETRFLVVILSLFLLFSLIFQIGTWISHKQFLNWTEYLSLFLLGSFTCFLMLIMLGRKGRVFLGKYLAGISFTISWTLVVLFLAPALDRLIISVYVLFFIFISFFREVKAVLITGLLSIICYVFLFFNYFQKGAFFPSLDLPFIIFCIGLIGFITQSSQKYYLDLLKAQEEAETARAILEVRVEARTSEIKKFAEDLSEQITEKTKKLQGKIEELEKFNKLAVGRELKMIELKEEIRKLKEELERLKGRK